MQNLMTTTSQSFLHHGEALRINSMSFTSLMLTCLQTTGAENLTRRAAIETDTAGADTRMCHNVLKAAAVKKTESEDIAPMKRGELIDLEMTMRAAVTDIRIATMNLGIVVTVTKKKCPLVTLVVRAMPSPEALMDLKNRKLRAIAATKTYDHANPARLKSLLHVASLRKTRAESVEGDLLMLTVAIEPIRLRLSQVRAIRLLEHPDETVVSLPITVLEVLAANVARQMNRPPMIDAKQKGQSDEHERKMNEDASLHATTSQGKKKMIKRGREKGEARAKSPHVNQNPSVSHFQR
ncbi:hypothetical protein FGSG_13699 [Fusarium graminearum PH-1]|uniref:hypothetical protein n=1 Tax=Gibberella zeae (strain ATCC MYA-4620 / CBS 123657 / FGSC 9075 / NRRL 31084 / PH-1) TaxID=229533 RepID=UPI00021F1984|nr:hypothetical protein FGSG_13699 [Fusarium graminearum PH-1]ESU16754.1 hypothetical protein FGSG_13699 [Fusarium graminearum PH-1]|eukprot:XP_011319016.1 hypothetical protein FGSG_13699 [Fusarium graminearum PH-1]